MSVHEISYHLMETERYPIFPQLLERSEHAFKENIQIDFALEMIHYYEDIFNTVKQLPRQKLAVLESFFVPKQ